MIPRWIDRLAGSGGILAYHGVGPDPILPVMHVSPEALGRQLEFVRERYRVVPLMELIARWSARRSVRGCVALTFDDAYLGVSTWAAPTLSNLDLPATVFVAANAAVAGTEYWWDRAELARRDSDSSTYSALLTAAGLPSSDALRPDEAFLRQVVLGRCHGRAPWGHAGPTDPWRSLTFGELDGLAQDERFDFGVHTVTHPNLPSLRAREQTAEIAECHRVLLDRLPRVRPVIAYPYGLYDGATVRSAKEAGMVAGVSMEGRAAGNLPDLFAIPRAGVGEIHTKRSIGLRLNFACRPLIVFRNGGAHPRLPPGTTRST